MTEKTAPKQVKGRFKPGQSGNPSGRPRGARHRTTLICEKLMRDDAKNIVDAVLAAARNGDMSAARIVLDRIVPARRDPTVFFELPKIEGAADAAKVSGSVLKAVAAGELTPAEAEAVTKIVETHLRAIEATDFEARLSRLELRVSS
ncbi:MAG: hypothetical protein CTY30_00865 [Methylocystis sp.]|nr:MAG: hypothetical protein CTY30_00865 [Methylocystis sp.]